MDIEPYAGGRFAMGGFELDPGGARFVEFEPGRKATLRFADGMTDSWELEGSDGNTRLTGAERVRPRQPAVPGLDRLAGWPASPRCGATTNSRKWRPSWRQIQIAGGPEGMISTGQ